MDSLVSAQWLAERLDDPHLRVFDATVQVRRRFLVPTVRLGGNAVAARAHPGQCLREPVRAVRP